MAQSERRRFGVRIPAATVPRRKNRQWQINCQTLDNRCECHGDEHEKRMPRNTVDVALLNGHECRARSKIWCPLPVIVTSPYEWKILKWDLKSQTNKQKTKLCLYLILTWLYFILLARDFFQLIINLFFGGGGRLGPMSKITTSNIWPNYTDPSLFWAWI